MGIRIQPRGIDIPNDPAVDPFKNDLLDRKEKAEVLTSLVSNIDGPCVMAVDAAWGAGKTTFLKMWAQYLRNKGFPVVEFNAWETDASGEPFVALTSEITEQLKGTADSSRLDQVSTQAKELIRKLAPGLIRFGTSFVPIVGGEMGHTFGAYAEEVLTSHQEAKQSTKQFSDSLQELANALWEAKNQKPIIILIDELDRCRPSYAIELLETAKHIFGVDHVVFVLAVNRAELAHSVKALYGGEFDAEGYLRRFFDVDFRLPAPDRQKFIRNSLELMGVDEFLKNSTDQIARQSSGLVTEAFTSFFGQDDLSLRSVGQAIHRFGVVLSSLGDKNGLYLPALTVLSILNALQPTLYRQFVQGEISADQTIESLFAQVPYSRLRRTNAGKVVESVIIAARVTRNNFGQELGELEREAPLLGRYAGILQGKELTPPVDEQERRWARLIYDLALQLHEYPPSGIGPLGFDESVRRLELLSADLKDSS